jgi:chromosome partitioning protein
MNYKGGVGKSMLTREIAAELGRRGQRALTVDMDPQANLSRRLGFPAEASTPTLSWALQANRTGCAADVLVPCRWDDPLAAQIDLLPSSFDLENRISEAGVVGAVLRLRNVMTGLGGHHWRLYDCAPSLGHLTQMALVAAGAEQKVGVVLAVEPERDAVLGCIKAYEFVKGYAATLGVPHLQVVGIVINRNRGTEHHQSHIDALVGRFGGLVWEPYLPLWNVLADAQSTAVPLHAMGGTKAADMGKKIEALTDRLVEAVA